MSLNTLVITVAIISSSSKLQFFLSRLQTLDKVGQLFGRGLVSEDNRLMKSLNHD